MKYVVQTVPQRLDRALELRKKIKAVISLDLVGDPVKAFHESLFVFGGDGHVHLEDDVILCQSFNREIVRAVNQYPNDVINFFNHFEVEPDSPQGHLGRKFMATMCVYFPSWFADEYTKWVNEYGYHWLEKYQSECDISVQGFLHRTKRIFYKWYPCLVQHDMSIPSIVNPESDKIDRTTAYFYDDVNFTL